MTDHLFKALLKSRLRMIAWRDKEHNILQLSGGCDSTALFFCMLELGIKFECVHYCFDENSHDTQTARALCKHFGIRLMQFRIKPETIIPTIEKLKKQDYKGKVALQCLVGHYQMCGKIKNSIIVNASFADILFGSYKAVIMKGYKDRNIFLKERKKLLSKPNADATKYLSRLLGGNGNEIVYPFYYQPIFDYFFSKSYSQLKNKKPFYDAFRANFPKGVSPKRAAQQIASGVREYLKKLNFKGYN